MLRHTMGSDAFFAALAYYRQTYQHDSVTTAEFTDSISTSFGHDLTWFTDQWVMNPGSPDYEWNYTADNIGGQDYLKLAIWQKQDGEGYGLIIMPDRHPCHDRFRLYRVYRLERRLDRALRHLD